MFVDSTGSLGCERARDLRRAHHAQRVSTGRAHRFARAVDAVATHSHAVRAFAARGHLGPMANYRAH